MVSLLILYVSTNESHAESLVTDPANFPWFNWLIWDDHKVKLQQDFVGWVNGI